MYLYDTLPKDKLRETTKCPFGPRFDDELVNRAEKMEIWATSIKDPGDDYCLFRLIDPRGKTIAEKRINGY
jgi:hypothetical protein